MKTAIESRRFGDLLKLLRNLVSLHDELLALIRAKVEAMKQSDIVRMQELTGQEQAAAKRIHEREGLRRQLMDAIGEQLGLPPRAARTLSASQLAARIPEPQHLALLDVAGRLRESVSRMAAANRVAGAIAGQLVTHLEWVFASVKPRECEPVGYQGRGNLVARSDTKIIDAVG